MLRRPCPGRAGSPRIRFKCDRKSVRWDSIALLPLPGGRGVSRGVSDGPTRGRAALCAARTRPLSPALLPVLAEREKNTKKPNKKADFRVGERYKEVVVLFFENQGSSSREGHPSGASAMSQNVPKCPTLKTAMHQNASLCITFHSQDRSDNVKRGIRRGDHRIERDESDRFRFKSVQIERF